MRGAPLHSAGLRRCAPAGAQHSGYTAAKPPGSPTPPLLQKGTSAECRRPQLQRCWPHPASSYLLAVTTPGRPWTALGLAGTRGGSQVDLPTTPDSRPLLTTPAHSNCRTMDPAMCTVTSWDLPAKLSHFRGSMHMALLPAHGAKFGHQHLDQLCKSCVYNALNRPDA